MKHRILALFLALCLCLPLAACGKKQGYDPLEGVQTRVVTDSAGRQVEIPRSRHASYLRLYNELKDLKAWDRK